MTRIHTRLQRQSVHLCVWLVIVTRHTGCDTAHSICKFKKLYQKYLKLTCSAPSVFVWKPSQILLSVLNWNIIKAIQIHKWNGNCLEENFEKKGIFLIFFFDITQTQTVTFSFLNKMLLHSASFFIPNSFWRLHNGEVWVLKWIRDVIRSKNCTYVGTNL